MAKLSWDNIGTRKFEYGVDRGVLYLDSGVGVAWSGLTAVAENANVPKATPLYFDGVKYLDYVGLQEYGLTIKAYTYPDEFLEYDGIGNVDNKIFFNNQQRKRFGLSYRSRIGNDLNEDLGYKIHVFYDLTATPSDVEYETMGDSTELIEFEWTATTLPQVIPGFRPVSHIIIDSTKIDASILAFVENILYGSTTTEPQLIAASALVDVVTQTSSTLVVTDNGDGSWGAIGDNSVVYVIDSNSFGINSPNVVLSGDGISFQVSSS